MGAVRCVGGGEIGGPVAQVMYDAIRLEVVR